MEHKVSCPQCAAPLKSSKPIPAGLKVKCPRCGMQFNTPHTNGVGAAHVVAGVPAAVPAAGAVLQGTMPASATAAGAPPVAAPGATVSNLGVSAATAPDVALPPSSAPARSGSGKRLALLGGGAAAVLAVTAVVVLLCFSGGKTDETLPPSPPVPPSGPNWNLPSGVAKKPAPPPLIVLPPEQQKKVDETVQRAVEYLKQKQLPNGSWQGAHPLGVASLAGLALLEGGVKATDPPVAKVAKYVRSTAPGFTSAHEVYELSLAVLFLDRLGDAADRTLIQEMALRLVAAQTPRGGWSYRAPPLTKQEYQQLYTLLKDLKSHGGYKTLDMHGGYDAISPKLHNLPVIQASLEKDGAAKGPKGARVKAGAGAPGDNSNTQFACLAIWAARKHDVPLDRTLALVNKRFRTTQYPDGSWDYMPGRRVTKLPTMTAAGLLGLAIGFGVNEHQGRPDDDPLVKKAMENLSTAIGEPGAHNGRPPLQFMYLMWSIERVGVLYQQKTINGKRWYEWGVEMLTAHQRADGSWVTKGVGGANPLVDTSFGILFLQRANLASDLTDKLMELAAAPVVAAPGPARKD